jgi:hypothetical protein
VTTAQNLNLLSVDPKFPKSLPVTTDQSINQGDMVWWDAVNGTLKPLTKAAQVAVGASGGFCGLSNDTTPINIYGEERLAALGVTRKGAVSLLTTPGEFYKAFQEVTVNETAGGDAQTITVVGVTSSNRVGWVVPDPPLNPQGAAGSTPVGEKLTGAAGVRARVWLEPKFPATTGI